MTDHHDDVVSEMTIGIYENLEVHSSTVQFFGLHRVDTVRRGYVHLAVW